MSARSGDPLAGTAFRAISELGRGGMGTVYLAEHRELGKHFVVKVLHDSLGRDARLVDRMRVEAQALGRLAHPNIVEVTGSGQLPDGRPWIAMERLDGRTLGEELRARGAIGVHEAVAIVQQVLRALDAAHAIGVIHRDVKLDNIFLHEPRAAPRVVKLLDFGIAKIQEGVSELSPRPPMFPTEEGVVVGTPRYVSPEAASGRPVDQRSDIYSAGLLLYVLLAGRGPFDNARTESHVIAAHANVVPDAPSKYARAPIPLELDQAVLKALSKRPRDRFQSAREFEAALAGLAHALAAPGGWLQTRVFDPTASAEEGRAPASDGGGATVPDRPLEHAALPAAEAPTRTVLPLPDAGAQPAASASLPAQWAPGLLAVAATAVGFGVLIWLVLAWVAQ